ncbi:MAG: hypothetical protein LBS19_03135 [Clostridiales bacterium]|jgi:hypothetical protein|nr:hypothetical protein [Clostridiales bacterium]
MDENLEIISLADENEDDVFVMVIHGFAPEFYDNFAFRIDKSRQRRKKKILCPYCGGEFEKVDASIKIEVFRCSANSKETFHRPKTCGICHRVVGVRYA